MSSAPQNFQGLRRLAAKLNLGGSAAAMGAGAVVEPNPDDEEGEATPGDEADPNAAPNEEGGEGEGGEGAGDEGDGEGEGGEGEGAAAAAAAPVAAGVDTNSADYRAGYDAAQATWATVLVNPAARGNIELATDLLAEGLTASAVISMCERHKGNTGNIGLTVLDNNPRPNVASGARSEEPGAQADGEGRKVAASKVNKRVAKIPGATSARARREQGRKSAKAPAAEAK